MMVKKMMKTMMKMMMKSPLFVEELLQSPPAKSSKSHQDEILIGMDVLLYAWTGPETPVAKAAIISVVQTQLRARIPLDQHL